jgi:hypothetical protein
VVDEALRGLEIPNGADLLQDVESHFKVAPQERWAARVDPPARKGARPDEGRPPGQLTAEKDG